jgi:hypothetical protein
MRHRQCLQLVLHLCMTTQEAVDYVDFGAEQLDSERGFIGKRHTTLPGELTIREAEQSGMSVPR